MRAIVALGGLGLAGAALYASSRLWAKHPWFAILVGAGAAGIGANVAYAALAPEPAQRPAGASPGDVSVR